MKLRNPTLRLALAGEYVAGTLHGSARKRFETLLESDPLLRGEVESWQSQLYRLVDLLPEQAPPLAVWERLSGRVIPQEASQDGVWNSLLFWRSASVLAAAFAVLLVIGVGRDRDPPGPTDYHVVVADEEQRAAWLISTELERQSLQVKTLFDQTLTTGQSFELWLIVSTDTAPISLGLIRESGTTSLTLTLTAENISRFSDAAALAVSLEPAGGSPTGVPTGPVLYQGGISL